MDNSQPRLSSRPVRTLLDILQSENSHWFLTQPPENGSGNPRQDGSWGGAGQMQLEPTFCPCSGGSTEPWSMS